MAQKYSAIMFDLDGVLADTEPIKALAHAATIESLGGRGNPQLYRCVIGRSFREVMAFLTSAAEITPDPHDYDETYRSEYMALLPRLSPMPGAFELAQRVAGTVRLAVVSSSRRDVADRVLKMIHLRELIDIIVTADDVTKEKPDPEPYLVAARELRVPVEGALAFEDSETGIRSAAAAGATVIAVRHDLNRGQDFALADFEVTSLLDSALKDLCLWSRHRRDGELR